MAHKQPFQIILSPIVTEGAMRLSAETNTYVFRVKREANKIEIGKAVERLFDVTVVAVRTATLPGKWKRVGTASRGRLSNWKKAYVKLGPDQSIDFDNL